MIDQQTIDRIFDAADIVEVISDFITLKKAGANYKALSPFTNEKTPSFFVSPAKQIFKDFSSGLGGNVVKFLMEHEKLSYPEALRYLANKYNIEISEKEESEEEKQQRNERESMLLVTRFAQKYFSEQLWNTQEGKAVGLSYLRERGMREDLVKKFELGYSPERRDAFTRHALEKGYKKEYLVSTGLTVERDNRTYDRFAGRIIFPIHALSGNVLGFGGRALRSGDKIAKYLNSPESEIYHKSRVLYGLYQAKNEIIRQEKCFMVEGYTDVIALCQSGIDNVVSSSGTAMTTEQVRLVKRFTENLTIIYDGDEAGIKASLKGIDVVLEAGMNVRVVLLPDGEDPDSYSKKLHSEELKSYIRENEKDFITFKTNLLLKEASGDPVKRAGLIQDVVRSIAVIPENITRSVYIKECARLLDTEERILYAEVYKIRRKKAEDYYKKDLKSEEVKLQTTRVPSYVSKIFVEEQEKLLIRFLLQYGNERLFEMDNGNQDLEYITVAEFIINEIQNDQLKFSNLVYANIFEEIFNKIKAGEVIDSKDFIKHPDEDFAQLTVDLLSFPYTMSKIHSKKGAHITTEDMLLKENVPKAVLEFKRKILEKAQKEKEKEIASIQDGKNTQEDITELQAQKRDIDTLLNTISKPRGWVVLK